MSYGLLSGGIDPPLGRYTEAAETAAKAIKLDPEFPFAYVNLATAELLVGRAEDARRTIERAVRSNVSVPDLLVIRFAVAFVTGNRNEMERTLALSDGNAGAEDWVADLAAAALAYAGHLREARAMSRRAVDLAQTSGERERAAQHWAAVAVREALFGNVAEATSAAQATLNLSNGRDAEYGAAIALALSGASSQSAQLAVDLERRFTEDTLVQFSYLPTLRALTALQAGRPPDAVEALQPEARYELGCRDPIRSGSSVRSTRSTCGALRIWRRGRARTPRPSSRRSSIVQEW